MNDDIKNALEVLRQGGVILYPTDTVWGLGCDATNEQAVARIFEIKKRADSKSMILLVDTPARIFGYVDDVPDVAMQMYDIVTDPTTIILEGAKNLAPNVVCSDDNSVGIRVADDDFCRNLISRFRKPIVSTSANISGNPTPSFYSQIDEQIVSAVDYVVKYRQDDETPHKPSSIIKIGKGGQVKIIRK